MCNLVLFISVVVIYCFCHRHFAFFTPGVGGCNIFLSLDFPPYPEALFMFCYIFLTSGIGRSIIGGGGGHIHIFMFTYLKDNRFPKKLIMQNTNI